MSGVESWLVWLGSFLVFLLMLYICYKISYRLGIKKALYRTTYIILSVIFAFVLSPLLNVELLKMDLTNIDITLTYQGEEFYTLVDYIEEVIVHNDFLNDLYKYFPSLKDLLMDFPEVVLAPVTYVLLFIIFMIVWMPLYLYLSYKRKRRILYEREDKKSHRVWAGVIGCFQCIFIISVVLTPINGLNRIYHSAMEDTLDDEYVSLCEEISSLEKYSKVCEIFDLYNSTIFATMGRKESFNSYVFDALTRISYEDGYTSIEKEATLIMKSSIVVDQSGLLDAADSNDVIPIDVIVNNKLSDEDIDIIVETLSQSKYSQGILMEVGDVVVNTLDNLLSEFMGYEGFSVDHFSLTTEEVISEIKVILKAIESLSGSNLLSQVLEVKDIITHFMEEIPDYLVDDIMVFTFIVDMVNAIDIDAFEMFCESMFESKIFSSAIPFILDNVFADFGFTFVADQGDVLNRLYSYTDTARLMKKYQPTDFFDFMVKMSDEDLIWFADLFTDVSTANETKGFVEFIFSKAFAEFQVYSMADIYSVKNWREEVFVAQAFCEIMHNQRVTGEVDVGEIIDFLQYSDTEFGRVFINIIQRNLDFFVKLILTGGAL